MALLAIFPGYHHIPSLHTNPTKNIGSKTHSTKTTFRQLQRVPRNIKPLSCLPKELLTSINEIHLPAFKLDDEFIVNKARKVNEALEKAIPLKHPVKIHEAMRYSLLAGGKRIRPLLCLASCELVGSDESLAMPMACAVEMIHSATLIFDDLPCMDNDDIRRGKPTTHKAFGEETAILAAGALLTLSFEHIAKNTRTKVPLDRVVRTIVELGSAAGSVGFMAGQLMDLHSEGKEVSLRELEYIHVNKAGKLLEASVVCGAIIGGANEMEVDRLRKFGRLFGLSFQILDDISGITKSSEELGKTAGKDLETDKATYPKLMGIAGSNKFTAKLVSQALEEIVHFDALKAAPFYYWADYILKN